MSRRILLVEDEALIAMAEAQMLKKYGYEVLTAHSGEKAIETVDSDPGISLILMDIDLGKGIDGPQAAERILAAHDLPIVFLSSHTEPEVVETTERITSYGYVVKNSGATVLDASIKMAFRLFDAKHEARRHEEDLRKSEATVRKRLKAITEPEGDISTLELADIIDVEELQQMMEDAFKATRVGGAILDVSGKILVSTTMEDICSEFHRVHPDTAKNCLESDLALAGGVPVGTFKSYRCKNNMWDMVTPLEIGGKHLGNIYVGQFFFAEEDVDYEVFRRQAQQHGFDETAYLAALDRVPRLKRETVNRAMAFYSRLARMISSLSYTTIKLSRNMVHHQQTEKALKDSHDLLNATQRIAGIGGWEWDVATDMVTWSEGLFTITGLDPNSPPPQSSDDHHKIFTEESWKKLTAVVDNTLKTGEPYEIYAQMIRPDGEIRDVYIYGGSNSNDDGSIYGLFGIVEDITDKNQRERQLKQSEENLRITLNSIGDAVISTDTDGTIVRMNPVAESLCGWSLDEAKGKSLNEVFHIVHADTEPTLESTDLEGMPLPNERRPFHLVKSTGRSVHGIQHTIVRPDGTRVDLSINANPILDEDDEFRGMVATIEDITKRRQAEELLRDRNATLREINEYAMELGFLRYDELYPFIVKKLNTVFKTSTTWVTEYDEATSDMVVRATSLSDADNSWVVKQIGKTVVGHRTPVTEEQYEMMRRVPVGAPQTLHEVSFGAIPKNVARLVERGFNLDWIVPVAFIDRDGLTGAAVIAGKPGEEAPDRELLLAFADITGEVIRRKRAEEELAEKKEFLQTISTNMLDLIAVTDRHGTYTFVSKSHGVLGYDIDDLLGKTAFDFVHPEDIGRIETSFKESIESDEPQRRVEFRYRCADGSYIWVETVGNKLPGKDGEMKGLLFSSRDITERKRNEERLRKIIDHSPLLIHELAASGHYLMANEATCALLGMTREELIGKHLDELLPADTASTFKERIDHVVMTREQMTVDDTLHIDGRERIFRSELFPVDRHDDSLPSVIAMAYELTEEIRLNKEKDFLMKELNHRIKNSLNMVSSLVKLKESQSEADLSDIKHQIKAISLIHEKLYETESVTEICLKSYIAGLLSSIVSFSARHVRIEQNIDQICIPTKQAMTLGLIINEIATNAIKHGFTDTQEPILSVKMEADRNNSQYQITLSNTGKPFPEEIGLDNPQTLGLQLISALTAQLGGAIELQRTPHPAFTIRFPTGE